MTTSERHAFGAYVLDVGERRLTGHGQVVPLPPKAYDVLVALVRKPGQLVTKRELLDAVWPDAFVEEGILTVHVSALRKALDDSGEEPRVIETVRRSGYRFIAPIARPAAPGGERVLGLADALTDRARARVYELCGLGKMALQAAAPLELPRAVEAFTSAIDLDPSHAAAHAGLALAHCARASMRVAPPREAYAAARAAALRALALDGASADAQVALGTVLFFGEWDFDGAERCLRRALALDPSHQLACVTYGRLLDACNRPQEALAAKQRALQDDPRSQLVHVQIALSYWNRRDFDQAIEWAEKALAIDERHLLAREFLVGAYLQKGEHDRALSEAIRHAESFGVPPEALQPLKDAYASGGRAAVVRYTLDSLRTAGAPPFQMAVFSAEAGDLDAAFTYLDDAIVARDPALVDFAVSPLWDPLRCDPRFAACVARIGLPA